MNLNNKIALVSGGSNGIGKEIARQLIEEGAKVYITGRNEQRLTTAAAEIGAIGIQSDVSLQSSQKLKRLEMDWIS
jgi:NADP-dependent 3-hydroxy acid dehydrogenase YdfG